MTRSALRVLAVIAALGLALAWNTRAEERGFPHVLHQRLFPTCTACHPGAVDSTKGPLMAVTAKDCSGCHNGDLLDRVDWTAPTPPNPFLRFNHAEHVTEQGLKCATCHQDPGAKETMAVVRAKPEACLECHGGTQHLSMENECRTCHPRLTQAPSLSPERLAALPQPPNHAAPDFGMTHGVAANASIEACATCHAREQCEVCHLNADSVSAIQKLGRDPRVAGLVAGRTGTWPEPESHRGANWAEAHGREAAANSAECANCHTRSSCEHCHGPGQSAEAQLFEPEGEPQKGVTLPLARPPDHDPAFRIDHGTAAAAQALNCASCHARNFCQDCHAAPASPGFHPKNFFARHAADAYARDSDCASCHSTETFCRDCHAGVGLSPKDARTSAYHDASPMWLLQHGDAARQGLETCASCHQQTDCLRCHSAKSGWRIDPHGNNFDADRLGDRSLLMCSRCHFSDPRK